jgi:hypothetical protein
VVIDKALLLAHLRRKAEHKNLLIASVIGGLITAVERGDFDTKESTN